MTLSIFNLFSIGIGPSSSHTVGPMKAAREFSAILDNRTRRIQIELFGSLAYTGKGHGTDSAILLGLEGNAPDTINPDIIQPRATEIIIQKQLLLPNDHRIPFCYETDLLYNFKELLPFHTNGMRFTAYDENKNILISRIFYSIGGGFIVDENPVPQNIHQIPYPFSTTKELLKHCEQQQLDIKSIMLANESALHSEAEVLTRLYKISDTMRACINKGCNTPGILPGGLQIKRRAPELLEKMTQKGKPASHEYTDSMSWLNLYAIAVNEENAAGSRVVTAPTNGAAGLVPAVLHYYLDFYPEAKQEHVIDFLLTAGAIAILY
jgi:L-serine dehydratase